VGHSFFGGKKGKEKKKKDEIKKGTGVKMEGT